jgi:DNA-binding transcriptional ArsR family regulator
VSAAAVFARLQALGEPQVTTGEAAAALGVSISSASRSLRTLADRGLIERVRHGLWRLEHASVDPRRLAREVTRPYPAYVSFESALSAHGMIDQLPREVALASLGRPRRVRTSIATYRIHRLPPELFGGFEHRDGVDLAKPEKALFDSLYVASAAHRRRRLPELEMPRRFSRREVDRWVALIRGPRLRARVAQSVARALAAARPEGPRVG